LVCVGAAAKDLAHHRDRRGVGIERIEPGVVDDCSDSIWVADCEDGRGDPALAETGDQRSLEVECVDQCRDVVGQQVEADRAAGVHGLAAAAGVWGDHPEVFGQRVHVTGIGDRHAGPDGVGGDDAAVQQHQRVSIALVEVVDVDAVRVNGLALRCCDAHRVLQARVSVIQAGSQPSEETSSGIRLIFRND